MHFNMFKEFSMFVNDFLVLNVVCMYFVISNLVLSAASQMFQKVTFSL